MTRSVWQAGAVDGVREADAVVVGGGIPGVAAGGWGMTSSVWQAGAVDEVREADAVVVGGGIAGLAAAGPGARGAGV